MTFWPDDVGSPRRHRHHAAPAKPSLRCEQRRQQEMCRCRPSRCCRGSASTENAGISTSARTTLTTAPSTTPCANASPDPPSRARGRRSRGRPSRARPRRGFERRRSRAELSPKSPQQRVGEDGEAERDRQREQGTTRAARCTVRRSSSCSPRECRRATAGMSGYVDARKGNQRTCSAGARARRRRCLPGRRRRRGRSCRPAR